MLLKKLFLTLLCVGAAVSAGDNARGNKKNLVIPAAGVAGLAGGHALKVAYDRADDRFIDWTMASRNRDDQFCRDYYAKGGKLSEFSGHYKRFIASENLLRPIKVPPYMQSIGNAMKCGGLLMIGYAAYTMRDNWYPSNLRNYYPTKK